MVDNVKFIGDLHFGHKNIHKFRGELGLKSELEHREFLVDKWNSVVNKRDVVWVMGDSAFTKDAAKDLSKLRGNKFLVLGNHDLGVKELLPYFNKVVGFAKYKGFWLSHAPIHPEELRGCPNIHGHVHHKSLPDTKNYFNTSCENVGYQPITLSRIKERLYGS